MTGIAMGLGEEWPGLHGSLIAGDGVVQFALRFENLRHLIMSPSKERPGFERLLVNG